MTDSLIEAMARALFNSMCAESGRTVMWDERPGWPSDRDKGHARIGARAALSALEATGYVVVPKEPTEAMVAAADSAIPRFEKNPDTGVRLMGVDGAELAYAAMLAARPKVTE